MKTIANYVGGSGLDRREYGAVVIVVNRFEVPMDVADGFGADLLAARDLMATKPGFVAGEVGRNVDEPALWVLTTRWENVGSYRRALSSYEGKLHLAPLLGRSINEPSAYEPVEPGAELNEPVARGENGSTPSLG